MMILTGSDPLPGPASDRPCIAHGTAAPRSLNLANITIADNLEGLLAATVFTTQGYILVAPNYTGYDTSTLSYNPYLNADQEAKDMIDAVTAARSALPTSFAPTVVDSGKLFVTGYSQGGHVAMATHKMLQETGGAITASAPMSGPYAVAAFSDAVFYGEVTRGTPLFFVFTATGYKRRTATCIEPDGYFEARHATGIESLRQPRCRTQLCRRQVAERSIVRQQPPDPSFAPFTPDALIWQPWHRAQVSARSSGDERVSSRLSTGRAGKSRRRLPEHAGQPARGQSRERPAPRVQAQRSAHVGADRARVPVRRRRRSDRALHEHAADPVVLVCAWRDHFDNCARSRKPHRVRGSERCAQSRLRSREGGNRSRWRRRGSDVVSQHAGVAVLPVGQTFFDSM
jgi:hypothetical protein